MAGLLSTASLGILLGVLGIFLSESLETRIFLTDYGWRILIGLGAVAFALTIFFRYKVMESPDFTKLTEARELTTSPIREAIHKARRKLVFLTLIATYYPTVLTFAVYPFAVEYYSKVVGEKVVTLTFMGFALLAILFTLAGGALTTLIGWRGVLFLSILGSVVTLPLLLIHSLTGFIVFPVASIGWGP
ncbi:hypothetical protein [Sulfuracidifex metallicus]|uniref:hypothetical protein n=1 Tax=Sulfuracidifex metallicus TaxID=47303 RepID=UPI0012EE732B|nr:hypothetical protein [Sulfuracidifex metallicus]